MRIRLGLIVPSSNTTMEAEYRKILPDEFSLHVSRMKLTDVTIESLTEMEKNVEEEASKLADAKVDVIGYGCTSGSLIKGYNHDKEIVSKIEKSTGIKAIATAGAVIEALTAINVRKVVVATPYIKAIDILEKKFLEVNGFEVVDIKGLEIVDNTKIGSIKNETLVSLVNNLNHFKAEAIFISCTNLPTMNVIEFLEKDLQKPVISSNTATLWSMLRMIKIEKLEVQNIGPTLSSKIRD